MQNSLLILTASSRKMVSGENSEQRKAESSMLPAFLIAKRGESMADKILNLDMSQAQRTINMAKLTLSNENFKKMMYRSFNETGKHSRTVIKKDVQHKYRARGLPTWAGQSVQSAKVSYGRGGADVSCVIPVNGERGHIGGKGRFSASGGAKGWNSLKRKYRITARIIKGQNSVLPARMKDYGGYPPFRNLAAPKLNNITFTRETKKRTPIRPVVAIAVPQMVANRSRDEVSRDIMEYAAKRMQHNMEYMMQFKQT